MSGYQASKYIAIIPLWLLLNTLRKFANESNNMPEESDNWNLSFEKQ